MFFDNIINRFRKDKKGDTKRTKSHIKAKNLMSLSTNFSDKEVLAKVRELLTSLSDEQMKTFKEFLAKRQYLDDDANSSEKEVLKELVQIALNSTPKDTMLKDIQSRYNKNLEEIDKLKIQSCEITDKDKVEEILQKIAILTEENAKFLSEIRSYRMFKNS